MAEMIERFDIKRVNSNSSRLNPSLLGDLNRLELMRQLADPEKSEILVKKVQEMIRKAYSKNADQLDLNEKHIRFVLDWSVHRITSLNELIEGNLSFLWILPKFTKESSLSPEVLDELVKSLEGQSFSRTSLNGLLKEFSDKNNLTFNKFMKSLRTMLSGMKEGPSVAEMMEILGKTNTLERLVRTKNDTKK